MVSPLSPIQVQQQQPDIAGSLLAGRRSFQQSQLLGQAAQQNQQQITREDYEMGVQRARLISQLATRARQLPPEQRGQFISTLNPEMLRSVGIDPAQAASVPLDDQGLDTYIAQINSVIPQEQQSTRVQSSQILDDGTTIQLLADGQTRVTDPAGNEITGEARRKAIQEANRYGAEIQAQRAGMRTGASLEARVSGGGEAQFTEALGTGRGRNIAEAEARREVAASEAPKLVSQADDSIRLIDELLAHPGRDIATGATAWVPAIPGTRQADFINRFDQIKGQAFLNAFESLKGGGAITEVEGRAATQAINRLNRATSAKEFDDAARDLKGVLERAKANAQAKAGRSPSDSRGQQPSAPSGAPEGYAERRKRLLGY